MKKQNIQLWRVIACLLVFITHYSQRMWFEGTLAQLADFGKYGVTLFFIISGFLIANSCELYAREHTVRYIGKRMIKILPLYYCVILYYFIMHNFVFCDVVEDVTGYGWLRYIFLLNGIVPGAGAYFWDNLGITWTIPCFAVAYWSLPLVLKIVKNYYSAVLCFFASLFVVNHLGWFRGNLTGLYYAPYFFEGIVLFYCIKEQKQMVTNVAVCIFALLQHILARDVTLLYSYIFMLLIIATDSMHIENKVFNKVLEISDRYSYTFYLVHGITFIHILDRYPLTKNIRIFVATIGTAVLTVIVHELIEIPIQKWLNRIIDSIGKREQTGKIAQN